VQSAVYIHRERANVWLKLRGNSGVTQGLRIRGLIRTKQGDQVAGA
jgi:hypothetical protein